MSATACFTHSCIAAGAVSTLHLACHCTLTVVTHTQRADRGQDTKPLISRWRIYPLELHGGVVITLIHHHWQYACIHFLFRRMDHTQKLFTRTFSASLWSGETGCTLTGGKNTARHMLFAAEIAYLHIHHLPPWPTLWLSNNPLVTKRRLVDTIESVIS